MITGTVTIDGINDKDLIKLFEIKVKHEQSLTFNPQQLQTTSSGLQTRPAQALPSNLSLQSQPQAPQPQAPQPQAQQYKATFAWTDMDGWEAVQEIVALFKKKEDSRHEHAGRKTT